MEWMDRHERVCERVDWWMDEQMDRSTCHDWLWAEAGRCKELISIFSSQTDVFICLFLLSTRKDAAGEEESG